MVVELSLHGSGCLDQVCHPERDGLPFVLVVGVQTLCFHTYEVIRCVLRVLLVESGGSDIEVRIATVGVLTGFIFYGSSDPTAHDRCIP